MTITTKTTSVLHRAGNPEWDLNMKWFIDEQPTTRRVGIEIDRWIELGQPETITVTIEPGDTLNDYLSDGAREYRDSVHQRWLAENL